VTVALIALPLVCAVLIGFLPLDRRLTAALVAVFFLGKANL
jgi:hypothetical protein